MRKGENSLLELMPALRYGGEGRCLSLPCFRSTGKGLWAALVKVCRCWGPAGPLGTVTPSLQSCVHRCLHHREHRWVVFEGLADLQSPALWLTVKGLL